MELCLECCHKEGNALLHHITAVHSWTDTVVACLHHPASAVLKKRGEDCADCGVCSWCPPYTIRSWNNISIFHQPPCCIAMHVSVWLAVLNFLVGCSRKRTPRSEGIIQQWVVGLPSTSVGTRGVSLWMSVKSTGISTMLPVFCWKFMCMWKDMSRLSM